NQYETPVPEVFGGGVITPLNQLDGTVRVDVPLVDTGRWFRAAAADSAEDAATFRDEATRDAVRRQVVTTFYGYGAALGVRESARRSLGVAQAQHDLQQVRERAGAATQLEVTRARAEVQRNLQVLTDTETLVATTRRSLRTLTGIEIDEQVVLPPDDFRTEGTLEDLESRAADLPVVRAAEKDAEAAGRIATASNLAFVPSVTGQFTERIANAAGLGGHEMTYAAGIGLTWRLDGPTIFAPSVQGAQQRIAVLGAERQRVAARDQIHNDWRRLQASMEKVTAAGAQVEAAQKAAQVARDRYDAGAATQLEVIQAERDLFAAEVNQIQSRSELASSHSSLRISAGIPLQLD
ncbi:MAG TPA: TolC family protein, partial [Myxococcaceae bacterium]|nr:TolC family protein [Myxococcaceae bacterium]